MPTTAPTRPTPPPALLLRSLGHPDVLVDGVSVTWPARSAEQLLWYLHATPGGAHRRELLDALWGLEDTPASANRFRVALHRLRATLGRADAVTEDHGRYALHPDVVAASDTAALHRALAASRASGNAQERETLLRRALASAEGEYLPHLTGEWVEAARSAHRAAVVEANLTLSLLHCEARECPLAAQALLRAADTDPLIGEDQHQRLMACLATTRGKYAAIEHYRRYRAFLMSEVGDTPMPDTVAFAERLKGGEQPCVHAAFTPEGQPGTPPPPRSGSAR